MSKKRHGKRMVSVDWYPMDEAPKDRQVLIFVPPIIFSPALSTACKMEVGYATTKDPRSGKTISNYGSNCRWTFLPHPPAHLSHLAKRIKLSALDAAKAKENPHA